jgi:hypothetical protein
MAIAAGSPAIDRGTQSNCESFLSTDQRQVAFTDGNGDGTVLCDSGAYEAPTVFISRPVPSLSALWLGLLSLLVGAIAISVRRKATLAP